MSKLRVAARSRLSGTIPTARAAIARPTGTLIQNTHCQPGPSIKGPPMIQAAVAPMPPVAPQAPIALLRSAPSGKVPIRIDKAAGVIAAAPTPCTARAVINAAAEDASPQPSDATLNSPTPTSSIRLRPMRSATRPPTSSSVPNDSM
jgi:hypothetical protein